MSSHGIENLLLQGPHPQQQGHSWFLHQLIYWDVCHNPESHLQKKLHGNALLYICIFYFLYIMIFCHLKKLSGWGESVPPGASQCLETAKVSVGSIPLICKLTISEPNLLSGPIHPRKQYSSDWIIPGLGTRQLETTIIIQSPPKPLKLANPNCLLCCFDFFMETPIKLFASSFPLLLSSATWPKLGIPL